MKIKLEIEKTCPDAETGSQKCAEEIMEKIQKKYPDLIQQGENQNGHLSISHGNPHIVFLFTYDKKGIAESENMITKQTVTEKNSKVRKYTGTPIKEADLKKLI
tara:strand:+ start:332 stop:643 length:312 start_codon:yes stop_codon:yes gene_type:complete